MSPLYPTKTHLAMPNIAPVTAPTSLGSISVAEIQRVEFDVSSVAPLGASLEVGDLFLPSGDGAGDGARRPTTLVVCVPGGGMTRRYFDLPEDLPGRWSMARHLVDDHGLAVLTLDHLGVGESPPPDDPYTLTPRVVAAVNAHVVADAVAGLRSGRLVDGLGSLELDRVVGLGHSMGGMLTVHQQARHHSYDAVVLLGFGGAGLPEHLDEDEAAYAGRPDELELALPHWWRPGSAPRWCSPRAAGPRPRRSSTPGSPHRAPSSCSDTPVGRCLLSAGSPR